MVLLQAQSVVLRMLCLQITAHDLVQFPRYKPKLDGLQTGTKTAGGVSGDRTQDLTVLLHNLYAHIASLSVQDHKVSSHFPPKLSGLKISLTHWFWYGPCLKTSFFASVFSWSELAKLIWVVLPVAEQRPPTRQLC